MGAVLMRTDKNGTKYWSDRTCWKCGGNGYIWGYEHVDGARCWECGATGILEKPRTWKEYTPEYAEKLAERRKKKAMEKAPETNCETFRKIGFDENGNAWIVNGDTYAIKDDLKAAGAKFGDVGWHFDHANNGFDCYMITISDIADKDDIGVWQIKSRVEIDIVMDEFKKKYAPKTNSAYIGTIGDKIEIEAKYVECHTYETHITFYGETHYIYKFADANGNTIIWNTTSWQDIKEGDTYTIKGTIKEHSEYRGDKQTVMNRCKIK